MSSDSCSSRARSIVYFTEADSQQLVVGRLASKQRPPVAELRLIRPTDAVSTDHGPSTGCVVGEGGTSDSQRSPAAAIACTVPCGTRNGPPMATKLRTPLFFSLGFLLSDFQIPKTLSISNRSELNFAQTFVIIFPVKLPPQIF